MATQMSSAGSATSSVGLLKAHSPWLRKDGVYLGVFLQNSVLHFSGCVQVRVLAGLIHCNGYIIKPSNIYHSFFSPSTSPSLSLSPLDPSLQDAEFEPYLSLFRDHSKFHFHSETKEPPGIPQGWETSSKCKGQGCIRVDLGYEDTHQLDSLVKKDWKSMIALVLFKPLIGHVVPLLNYWSSPNPIFEVNSQLIEGFETVYRKNPLLNPHVYKQIVWEVVSHPGPTVLVCGEGGSGKSTFCRFLINYLLNRNPNVAYLECDPGQPEFTVPEVLSLHMITEPVFGPPFTHHRTPYKAYYYGDKTPREDPEYYIRLIQALHQHFVDTVRNRDYNTPLIINTCGWLSGMGAGLFLDILRSLSPTHIVRSHKEPFVDTTETLPPFCPELLSSSPGLFKMPDKYVPVTSFTAQSTMGKKMFGDVSTPAEDDDNDVVMYASSDEELRISDPSDKDEDTSAASSGDEEDLALQTPEGDKSTSQQTPETARTKVEGQLSGDRMARLRLRRQQKRRRLRLTAAKLSVLEEKSQAKKKRIAVSNMDEWTTVLSYRVFNMNAPKSGKKASRNIRRLNLITYFSGLFPEALEVARQHDLPDVHGNMLRYAPPMEIPWRDVSVHILHRNVPNSQSLYALNGRIVALGWVEPKEIIDRDSGDPDMVRFLRLGTPLIEFHGLGVIRGVDPVQKVFYVTSPECSSPHILARVNTIALGNPEYLDFFSTQASNHGQEEQPYIVQNFESSEVGQYTWKLS